MKVLFSVCVVMVLPVFVVGDRTLRDALIQHYFRLGYEYSLIICFLYFLHGITISLRHLKRTLRRLGLQRRALQSRALLNTTLRAMEVSVEYLSEFIARESWQFRVAVFRSECALIGGANVCCTISAILVAV